MPPAESADWRSDLGALYNALAAELDALDVACGGCGACCRFDEAGHVLYASTLERRLVEEAVRRGELPAPSAAPGRCPFQVDGACCARAVRTLGCRLHFCRTRSGDPVPEATRERLDALSATFHRQLSDLHVRADVPWDYRPFLDALAEALAK
ncbi:MAG: hypothetical protein ACOCX4_03900 [Planctomycetota bacterium]